MLTQVEKRSDSTSDRYWADKPAVIGSGDSQPSDGLAAEVMSRVSAYYDAITSNGMLTLWRRVHAMYYGLSDDGGEHTSSDVSFGGEFDERIYAKANHFRSIVQYLVTVTCADRPEFSPRALNSESRSMEQIGVARNVLEYYMRENKLEKRTKSAMERAILYGVSYVWGSWDPALGPMFAPTNEQTGQPDLDEAERTGDIRCRALSPMHVARETTRGVEDDLWYAVSEPVGRHDLAARFAKGDSDTSRALRQQIHDAESTICESAGQGFGASGFGDAQESEDIHVYHFYHMPTDALPDGRYTIIIPGGGVLFDGPLPYDDMPVLPVCAAEFLETGFGYTTVWDLMGLQDMYDAILSTCMTIVDAFGVANVLAPEGSELSAEDLRDGLGVIYYPPGMEPPTMLDLGGIREEMFKLREVIKSDMETIPGVNSVARGEPQASLKSGAALALVQAQALQFNSGLQGAYVQLLEALGTMVIRMLKRFAKLPRLAMIAGEHETEALREFKGDDLRYIDRVIVDTGNALQRTTAGKIQLAEWLLDKGLIKRPEQVFQVLESGRLDVTYRPDLKQMQLIQRENEQLKSGDMDVPVIFTDHPALHVQEHMAVASSPDVRNNPAIMKACTAHIMKHLEVWRTTDPDILGMLGYPAPTPMGGAPGEMPPGGPEGGGGGPPPSPQKPPGKAGPGEPIQMPGEPAMGMPGGTDEGPRMPRMPENPMDQQGGAPA